MSLGIGDSNHPHPNTNPDMFALKSWRASLGPPVPRVPNPKRERYLRKGLAIYELCEAMKARVQRNNYAPGARLHIQILPETAKVRRQCRVILLGSSDFGFRALGLTRVLTMRPWD